MSSKWVLLVGVLAISACDIRNSDTPASTPRPQPKSGQDSVGGGLTAADAPYVRGSVEIVGTWKEERLAAGFAGQGADGKPHSNMAGTNFSSDSGTWVQSDTFKPQITRIENKNGGNPEYRHTHLPPGDYVVYVQRGGVPAAWKKVTVKEGDEQTVDLTVDPAKAGALTVTLPDAEADDKIRWPLVVVPAGIDLPGTAWHQAFQAADMKPGEKTVSVTGIPAGKYKVVRGKSAADVEITAGKNVTVTLVRDESKK